MLYILSVKRREGIKLNGIKTQKRSGPGEKIRKFINKVQA